MMFQKKYLELYLINSTATYAAVLVDTVRQISPRVAIVMI